MAASGLSARLRSSATASCSFGGLNSIVLGICRHISTGTSETFRHADIEKNLTSPSHSSLDLENLRFGQTFTDHLLTVEHVEGQGWSRPQIRPLSEGITIHPAAPVLHYGMCCFEGMKAYLGVDGRGRLFRPDMNMRRLHRSSRRLLLADYDPLELLECLKELLRLERQWLPEREGYSLYIRPFIFSSSHSIGIGRPTRSTIVIMLSPVGPYFQTGLTPIKLFLDERNVRAWPGGVGDCKVGSNYAPTILPQITAQQTHGTPQVSSSDIESAYCKVIKAMPDVAVLMPRDPYRLKVLYTMPTQDSSDHDAAVISESGAMNVFFLLDKEDGSGQQLITPPLDGTILPGVTRDSVLQLARHWQDCEVLEAQITVGTLRKAAAEGRLREIFGCGTACIVQPVDGLVRADGEVLAAPFNASSITSMTARMTRALTDIQYARVPSDWSVPFDDAKIENKELAGAEPCQDAVMGL